MFEGREVCLYVFANVCEEGVKRRFAALDGRVCVCIMLPSERGTVRHKS